jgi:hypothetical protein
MYEGLIEEGFVAWVSGIVSEFKDAAGDWENGEVRVLLGRIRRSGGYGPFIANARAEVAAAFAERRPGAGPVAAVAGAVSAGRRKGLRDRTDQLVDLAKKYLAKNGASVDPATRAILRRWTIDGQALVGVMNKSLGQPHGDGFDELDGAGDELDR